MPACSSPSASQHATMLLLLLMIVVMMEGAHMMCMMLLMPSHSTTTAHHSVSPCAIRLFANLDLIQGVIENCSNIITTIAFVLPPHFIEFARAKTNLWLEWVTICKFCQ